MYMSKMTGALCATNVYPTVFCIGAAKERILGAMITRARGSLPLRLSADPAHPGNNMCGNRFLTVGLHGWHSGRRSRRGYFHLVWLAVQLSRRIG